MLSMILLFLPSSSRCLLSACFDDEVSARSEPSSGLVYITSLMEPVGIKQGDIMAIIGLSGS